MNIQFRTRGLNASASLRIWLEQELERLHSLMPVSAAHVRLERQQDASPSFQAYVHLSVSGPDIHATASDHTIQTVWLKVIKNLKRQIAGRKSKQETQHKRAGQLRGVGSRWSGPVVAPGG